MRVFSPIFWAIMLIVGGVLMLVNYIFHLNIRVFGVLFGIFFIMLGISIITNKSTFGNKDMRIFGNGVYSVETDGKADIIFSEARIDLDDYEGNDVKISCIFSSVNIKSSRPLNINANCAFGSVRHDGTTISFGDRNWTSSGEGQEIDVKIDCVFGSVNIN